MLARRLVCQIPQKSVSQTFKRPSVGIRQTRSFSWSSASHGLEKASVMPVGAIQSITDQLEKIVPRIDVPADNIQIINEPKEFYHILKNKISRAETRIFLATLYIGRTEDELIQCIRQSLLDKPSLKVSILTDALRGTREHPNPSCATLLSSLAAEFPDRVEIRMYHTPNLTGIRKSIVPKRLNEGWGLQHMKLYGIDDDIILSGANLSNDYFTNRQDRYHVISSKPAADYFARVHKTLCLTSFALTHEKGEEHYRLSWPADNPCVSPLDDPRSFVESSRKLFEHFAGPTSGPPRSDAPGTASVFPTIIIPQAVNTELPALHAILDVSKRKVASCMFTAGYFNPDPAVTKLLLGAAKGGSATTVVTASPWANGFYGSKGVSGMLPAAYTLLARRFLLAMKQERIGNVILREWRLGTVGRPFGWTYHAKGVWLSYEHQEIASQPPHPNLEAENPMVTVIGSSNYTVRSYSLDTEVGAVIVTRDAALRHRLMLEEQNLLKHTKIATEQDLTGGERRVGLVVRLAMWIVRSIGGSL